MLQPVTALVSSDLWPRDGAIADRNRNYCYFRPKLADNETETEPSVGH